MARQQAAKRDVLAQLEVPDPRPIAAWQQRPPGEAAPAEVVPAAGRFGRIHPSDLEYLGAFKLPDAKPWSFAKGAIAYVPTRNTLLAVGKGFEEIGIPEPVVSRSPGDLNEAVGLTRMFDPMAPLARALGPARSLGGVTWLDGRFWVGTWEFYNVAARDNLGITSFDERYGDPRGAWRVGPPNVSRPSKDAFHANKTHDYVMVIPESWSNVYAPGRRLAGGRHREAGANGGGRGPALYAFEADENAVPGSALNGVPLMYYQERAHTWPDYRKADRYHAIWIWRGNRQAVIVGSMKGLGPDFYGPGPPCSQDKGFHAHPYEPRMDFVDVNELGEVAQGRLDPWAIRAYDGKVAEEMWGYGEGVNPQCKREYMADWAFDAERGLLYASEPKAYDAQEFLNGMIVHVWRVR
jgi:hypothetical protein